MMLESVDPSINGTTETILKILYMVAEEHKRCQTLTISEMSKEVIRWPEYCSKVG